MVYRGAVIGLGWMGMLYDLAQRMGRWHVDDVDRPTPELDVHRRFPYYKRHEPRSNLPTSYTEALADRPDIELVAAAERDGKRLAAFQQRYGVDAIYTDAHQMLATERPEIVAIASNTKGRADLTCCAVECSARGIITEKPIAETVIAWDVESDRQPSNDLILLDTTVVVAENEINGEVQNVGSETVENISIVFATRNEERQVTVVGEGDVNFLGEGQGRRIRC